MKRYHAQMDIFRCRRSVYDKAQYSRFGTCNGLNPDPMMAVTLRTRKKKKVDTHPEKVHCDHIVCVIKTSLFLRKVQETLESYFNSYMILLCALLYLETL